MYVAIVAPVFTLYLVWPLSVLLVDILGTFVEKRHCRTVSLCVVLPCRFRSCIGCSLYFPFSISFPIFSCRHLSLSLQKSAYSTSFIFVFLKPHCQFRLRTVPELYASITFPYSTSQHIVGLHVTLVCMYRPSKNTRTHVRGTSYIHQQCSIPRSFPPLIYSVSFPLCHYRFSPSNATIPVHCS